MTNYLPVIQPVVDYEWTYSTIKDISYEPVTVFDSHLGGYVTVFQEKQTESVLPWFHRKQVVRYQTTTADASSGGQLPINPVASDTSERRIVNRLFPVSTVPSPPAQAVPVQPFPQPTSPTSVPMTIYAGESSAMRTTVEIPVIPTVTVIQSVTETLDIVTPAFPASIVSSPSNQPVSPSGSAAEFPPSLPGVIAPSSETVLYPLWSANPPSRSPDTTPTSTSGKAATVTTTTEAQSDSPTLAPSKPNTTDSIVQHPVTVQRPRIEDSLSNSEIQPRTFDLMEPSDGTDLRLPAQPRYGITEEPIPDVPVASSPETESVSSEVINPILTVPDTSEPELTVTDIPTTNSSEHSTPPPTTRIPSVTPKRQRLTVSPTRMLPL